MDILKYKKQLDFDRVCELVAQYAVCEQSRERTLAMRPYAERYEAEEALDATAALFKLIIRNRAPAISGVSGIKEIAMRAEKGGALSMSELLNVARMLKNARALNSWLSVSPELEFEVLDRMFFALYANEGFERRVGECILSEDEMADTASPELAQIRRKIARAELSIKDKLESLVRSSATSKYLQDAIITMRAGRYVVPVKNEHRGEIKGLVHDVSSSGSTYFIEPAAVVEANNQIVTLKSEENLEIERILFKFSAEVSDFAAQLAESYEAFLTIDCAIARARYAIALDAVKPEFCDDSVALYRARHPLISKDVVVPIDIIIGESFNSLIITGPNTGGKTVTLKTVGLLTLMAMCGMMIPAKQGSRLRMFSQILVDIGDEQSIAQNLSTFSGHIKNTIEILADADDNSLVLLDELGAGTDPAEGAALAIALLERFRSLGSTVIATTHYGEIKMYALETDGVQNASCEFDVKTLSPTYRISIGIPGRSNALLISERLGLDAGIIESARRNMKRETRQFEDLLAQIEQMKGEAAQEIAEAQQLKEKAQSELDEAQREKTRLKKQADAEVEAAKNKAKQMVADVTARAYGLLDEIKALDKNKEKDRQQALMRARAIAKTDAAKLFDMSDPVVAERMSDLKPVTDPKVGDIVVIRELGQPAEILSLPDQKGVVEVRAGNLKTRMPLCDLGRSDVVVKKKPKAEYVPKETVDSHHPTGEINVIGKTTEEAAIEVEQFIDDAMVSKIKLLYIIHGRGTGALRSRIHILLKRNKSVKSFRLGRYGEGEDGVTVVELK